MPTSIFGSQYYSISSDGPQLLRHPKYTAVFGSIDIDLTSDAVPAGTYEIRLFALFGSFTIYLPRYVKFSTDGTFIFGAKDVYNGLDWWGRMVNKFRNKLNLPNQIPEIALQQSLPQGDVTILVKVTGIFGGLDVYRI